MMKVYLDDVNRPRYVQDITIIKNHQGTPRVVATITQKDEDGPVVVTTYGPVQRELTG